MARATLLHNMKDNIISLFKGHKFAKEMMEALEAKYGPRSDTHIQLLLDKYNCARMSEGDYLGKFVNQMELIAKELTNVGHPVSDKMQVTTILNSIPLSCEHVVTSLTLGGKEVSMVSLPVLPVLEEERMKRRMREGTSNNLMMVHTIPQTVQASTFKGKPKKFNRKWKGKPKGKGKLKGTYFKCGKVGHFKVKCPKLNGNKRQKKIAKMNTEAMMAKQTSSSW
jgi:hypothetical protein